MCGSLCNEDLVCFRGFCCTTAIKSMLVEEGKNLGKNAHQTSARHQHPFHYEIQANQSLKISE